MNKSSLNKRNFPSWLNKRGMDYLLLFVLTGVYFGRIQWNMFVGDPDGYYHTKIALLLRQGQLLKSMPWMQFSTLRDNFTDHHLLYHLILVPFTYLHSDPLIAVKIATVFFAILVVLVFYWLLKKMYIIWPWLWAALFITLGGVTFRLSLIKANALSLILVWFFIYALLNRKALLAFFLSFIFVWLYGGWPLAILITIVYLIADKVYQRLHTDKLKIFWQRMVKVFSQPKLSNKKTVWAIALGLVAGLVINPYWPRNIYFYYQQVFQIGIVNQGGNFAVGGEWYGTTPMHVISAMPHLFLLGILIIILAVGNIKKISKQTFFTFLLTFIFILLTIKSRRYIEYLAPFTLLFVACGTSDIIRILDWKKIRHFWQSSPKYLKSYLSILIFVFAVAIVPKTIEKTIKVSLSDHWQITRFQAASNWLEENTGAGTTVFHADWDEWPALYYHNDHNYYIIGLDPTFMHNQDSQLHQLYINLTTTEIKLNLAHKIKENFGAEFVLAEKERHKGFVDRMDRDPNAIVVYQDDDVKIYKIQ